MCREDRTEHERRRIQRGERKERRRIRYGRTEAERKRRKGQEKREREEWEKQHGTTREERVFVSFSCVIADTGNRSSSKNTHEERWNLRIINMCISPFSAV